MKKPATEYTSRADSSIIRPAAILAVIISILLILTLVFFIIAKVAGTSSAPDNNDDDNGDIVDGDEGEDGGDQGSTKSPFNTGVTNFYPSYLTESEGLVNLANAGLNSPNVALVDVSANKIIASSKSQTVIYPASMTKVMTLIVVFENLTSENQLKEKITLDAEIVDKMIAEQSSGYGFKAGDVLTVEELIHAVILYSDGTACLTLADYICGSEAKFVELMNAKATEMGLQNTLFQNSTGLHHKYHYSTCQDMAAIMMYAMKNPHCARILTAQSLTLGSHFRPDSENTYTMYNQALHSSKFTQPNKITVTAAKTGWTEDDLSGYCFVSYGKSRDGKAYILVTAGADTVALRNQDTVTIYDKYAK